jgi:alpha,alpha-trehalase
VHITLKRAYVGATLRTKARTVGYLLLASTLGCAARVVNAPTLATVQTPYDVYGELFVRVQLSGMFPDSKAFADALPNEPPAQIVAEYRAEGSKPGFSLGTFVAEHFRLTPPVQPRRSNSDADVRDYIDRLWNELARGPDPPVPNSSKIALPYRYIVPGGRFTEIYYWDSYFSMLGLEASGRHDLTLAMLRNFAWLIDRYGYVPNGTRTYYLSRSQPPVFSLMVELVAERDGDAVYRTYLPELKREYAFWMEGESALAPHSAHRRVVRLRDGSLLNRYWDDRETPREEAYREDVATAHASTRPARDVYRNLRAGAESGWDFSSRWLADDGTLATIHTVDLLPPDLNSLLFLLESTIAKACGLVSDAACVSDMQARAAARKRSMWQQLWNPDVAAFTDYDWRTETKGRRVSAATLLPLYAKIGSAEQAAAIAQTIRSQLLLPNGLSPTPVRSGQQWDAPNGWAPLQWIAICGLRRYAEHALADQLTRRWVETNLAMFSQTGALLEKYDLDTHAGGAGGEYSLQEGFGWTNGVLRRLLE